tara:strand:- start:117 stop:314 length:198 start_codon:yes stop_codon:yes gene_type:complete
MGAHHSAPRKCGCELKVNQGDRRKIEDIGWLCTSEPVGRYKTLYLSPPAIERGEKRKREAKEKSA